MKSGSPIFALSVMWDVGMFDTESNVPDARKWEGRIVCNQSDEYKRRNEYGKSKKYCFFL